MPVSVPLPLMFRLPALMLTMPVLLKLPTQPKLTRPNACAPLAFLLRVPALLNSACTPESITMGPALVLSTLNTPPASFTKVGLMPDVNRSRSSPPSITVPALSQRRSSPMDRLPSAAARLMVLVEPAGVSKVPLPLSVAALPLAVKLPVTVTVPVPPRAGLVPPIVSVPSVEWPPSASRPPLTATLPSVAPPSMVSVPTPALVSDPAPPNAPLTLLLPLSVQVAGVDRATPPVTVRTDAETLAPMVCVPLPPLWVMVMAELPVVAVSGAFTVTAPVPVRAPGAEGSLALSVRLLTVIGLPMTMFSPACSVRLRVPLMGVARPDSTVMSLLACSTTLALSSCVLMAPLVMTLVAPAKAPNSRLGFVRSPLPVPSMLGLLWRMTMNSGSSSSVP